MKPAPFEDVDYKVPDSSIRVVSKQNPPKTEIKSGLLKKVVWSMPQFIGRKNIDASSDGKLLGLSGNEYFGMSVFKTEENPVVTSIYDQGKEIKSITIKDIFGKDMSTLIKEYKLNEIGGGWVSGKDLITKITFDWKAQTVTYSLVQNNSKTVSF